MDLLIMNFEVSPMAKHSGTFDQYNEWVRKFIPSESQDDCLAWPVRGCGFLPGLCEAVGVSALQSTCTALHLTSGDNC